MPMIMIMTTNSILSTKTDDIAANFHARENVHSTDAFDIPSRPSYQSGTERQEIIFLSLGDPENLVKIRSLLTMSGFDVQLACNEKEANNMLQKREVTILLVDNDSGQSPSLIEFCQSISSLIPEIMVILLDNPTSNAEYKRLMTRYTFSYLTKPCDHYQLLNAVFQATKVHRLQEENRILKTGIGLPAVSLSVPTCSPNGLRLAQRILTLGKMEAPVLISGEYGTGKNIIAQLIHQSSDHAAFSFDTFSSETYPDIILEEVLFGKKSPAYPNRTRIGRFDSGTILLDHIENFSRSLQWEIVSLLKKQNSNSSQNIRVLFSTRLGLTKANTLEQVRSDLIPFLKPIALSVPPLRERKEDIPQFCRNILARWKRLLGGYARSLADSAIQKLASHFWPGNIRELESVLFRATEITKGDVIQERDIIFDPYFLHKGRENRFLGYVGLSLEKIERLTILETLRECGGKIGQAAEVLGVCRQTLGMKIRSYHLSDIT